MTVDDALAAVQAAAGVANAYVPGTVANLALRAAVASAAGALAAAVQADAGPVAAASFTHAGDVLAADAAAGALARDVAALNEMRCVAAALVPS